MTRLLDDAHAGRLCLGTLIQDVGTFALEPLAKAGMSFVFLDMMFGTLGWNDVRHMTTAARAAGMTSLVRIPNYPWAGDPAVANGSLAAQAARAVALGADGVRCSVSSLAEAEQIAAIANDWHRVPSLLTSPAELRQAEEGARESLVIMPIIESTSAWEDLEEIMALGAVNTVMISGTDLPRQMLGLGFEYEHAEVWKLVDHAVDLGRRHDVVVGFNTGYVFKGVEETAARIHRIREHGVGFVLVQTLDHMIYAYTSELVCAAGRGAAERARRQ